MDHSILNQKGIEQAKKNRAIQSVPLKWHSTWMKKKCGNVQNTPRSGEETEFVLFVSRTV
ncbi:hypothetical protein RND71_015994 [Anisodus tanguticus]|uniref:Uncharacterized protein n=1 Tax=Anisodus tanguticus TaxID=243964 RepID=A0AAE1S7B9_9SOLA|nr:hypothetical protein RND71_015994 [Anisodus tanguticus]